MADPKVKAEHEEFV